MLIKVILNELFPALSSGAYTLTLIDKETNRIVPMLIGTNEAQAISMELEGKSTIRPYTHDLLLNFLEQLQATLTEVIVYDIKEGIFYSKINFSSLNQTYSIESRTSDAVCLAIKSNIPIFIEPKVMDEVSYTQDGKSGEIELPNRLSIEDFIPDAKTGGIYKEYSLDQLKRLLEDSINKEDYSTASKIRDEILKRK